ncbi:peptidoglycan-binding protein, partial [Streptomyces sp. NPDC060053]
MPTPEEPGKPHERPVLEPIRVLRPRNTDALAELFREMAELTRDPDAYESIPLRPEPSVDEAETQELPPLDPRTVTAPAMQAMPATPAMPTPRGGRDWASERGGPRPLPGGNGPGSRRGAARERGGSGAAPAADGAR